MKGVGIEANTHTTKKSRCILRQIQQEITNMSHKIPKAARNPEDPCLTRSVVLRDSQWAALSHIAIKYHYHSRNHLIKEVIAALLAKNDELTTGE